MPLSPRHDVPDGDIYEWWRAFEYVNGQTVTRAVLFFACRIVADEPPAFDYNGNGRIDFADVSCSYPLASPFIAPTLSQCVGRSATTSLAVRFPERYRMT